MCKFTESFDHLAVRPSHLLGFGHRLLQTSAGVLITQTQTILLLRFCFATPQAELLNVQDSIFRSDGWASFGERGLTFVFA